jgi:TctA family transporter
MRILMGLIPGVHVNLFKALNIFTVAAQNIFFLITLLAI